MLILAKQKEAESSHPRTGRPALNRHREAAHDRLVQDYFAENDIYDDNTLVDTAILRPENIMMMEVDDGSSQSCASSKEARKHPENNGSNNNVFINHGLIDWNENRRKWNGDQSQRSQRGLTPEDPVISWSTTYEDLLSNNDRFPEPIPLPEMVDFLVDIWLDEGLYD